MFGSQCVNTVHVKRPAVGSAVFFMRLQVQLVRILPALSSTDDEVVPQLEPEDIADAPWNINILPQQQHVLVIQHDPCRLRSRIHPNRYRAPRADDGQIRTSM